MTYLLALILAIIPAAAPAQPPLVAEVLARWEWFGLDVKVTSEHCDQDNAWYNFKTHVITMCDDLYDRPDLARWILAHELGHAFMWQRDVPQRRGTLDQERVADEMAFLMSTTDEGYAAASWFLGAAREELGDDPDDEHPTSLDRAASLLCLLDGREGHSRTCQAFYSSVLAHWVRILDGYL